MATAQQGADRIDSMEPLNTLTLDAEEKSVIIEDLKEQTLFVKDEKKVLPDISCDSNVVDMSRDAPCQLGSLDVGGDQNASYPSNVYAPQAQTLFYGGYGNTAGEWGEYPQYFNGEGMEVGSTGVYNENPSLMFHGGGYGYNPQMPYGPYSPVTTPLPNASGDGQMYSQNFSFTGHYYQQPSTPGMPYLTSPNSISQADLRISVHQHGAFPGGNSTSNGILFGQRPNYHLSYDSLSRDWSRTPDGTGSFVSLSSPAASPQPIGAHRSFGQNMAPAASGMLSQQQRSLYGYGSSLSSYDRGYSHCGMYHQGNNFGGLIPSPGTNGRTLTSIDKGRRRGKGNASACGCNVYPDFLTEQNRGPRASRPKNPAAEHESSLDNKNESAGPDRDLYNKLDFTTEYKDAKFFIIKSYSEDNVHKSIKYGVWASTSNGNRKLDSAYREMEEKDDSCPVFLFFSVNASAQFVGVAEMIGRVDFERSVDYWQQDKWSGQFPVKWHIVKDVPNNLFHHIILENNDNKPVTNSRDTQEVKLEQGLEMLNIFKKHEADLSILDDFDFYEKREKAMQERKALQLQQQKQSNSTDDVPSAEGNEQRNPEPNSGDLVNQISSRFADAVRLDESNSSCQPTDAGSSVPIAGKPEDTDSTAEKVGTNG